ncbi:FlaA1/EpsC-like NDP-sugar epimerase [Bradyrhizobium elkanii]
MTRLSQLTLRNFLILVHDALATTFALLASFYLRFEGSLLTDRLPHLLLILPWFVLFSVFVSYFSNLTTAKWRFTSLPDAVNILRVAAVLTLALVVLDYVYFFTGTNSQRARCSSAGSRSSCSSSSRCSR